MSAQDAFDRILASLYDAMLDESQWPATSALIDDACGMQGNALLIGDGPPDAVRVFCAGFYYRGQRRPDLEREYLEVYHPMDERVPRLRQLPDSHLVHVTALYTAAELQTSPTYSEFLRRIQAQDGVQVRLDGPAGSHFTWVTADPITRGGLGVPATHAAHRAPAPSPAICPRPPGAGRGRGAGDDRDRAARSDPARRPPPGPARADCGRQ